MLSQSNIKDRLIDSGFRGRVNLDVPLAPLTYYKIGGPADIVADAVSVDDVILLINLVNETGIEFFVLGAGSNVLVSDEGYRGLIIRLDGEFAKLKKYPDESILKAGASVPLSKLLREGASIGMSGIERLAGIPGLIGGAVFMNAGTFGEHIGDLVVDVEVVNPKSGHEILPHDLCAFGYRSTRFQDSGDIILACTLQSKFRDPAQIEALIDEKMEYRKKSQPIENPSCGCVFRNPENRKSAAVLIQETGLKGTVFGGAVISEKHGNFIINLGGAKASDVLALMALAKKAVLAETGVDLEPEVRMIGFDKSVEELLDERSKC